ncbi:MAG: hypothetical protein COB02_17555 [Candidatus Cloacimonadota bacterium]|nr:MAG: hypothetical protein COB02_17555 [Candidatus Cloacimonadota bacterium]
MSFFKLLLRYIISILPIDPSKILQLHVAPLNFIIFIRNYFRYNSVNNSDKFNIKFINSSPNLFDRNDDLGKIPKHYFHQDLWMAQKIFEVKPSIHYDIGSRLDGFIANCLVFTKVIMLDIRGINFDINNLSFVQTNATDMSNILDNSIDSISSLHAVEHFGLGRYGDPIDPNGYIKAIKEIQRVAKEDIYFAVPIGVEKLIFDSHRIFDPKTIIDLFDECQLLSFAAIDDNNKLNESISPEECTNYKYGCGLFHFRKILATNS